MKEHIVTAISLRQKLASRIQDSSLGQKGRDELEERLAALDGVIWDTSFTPFVEPTEMVMSVSE